MSEDHELSAFIQHYAFLCTQEAALYTVSHLYVRCTCEPEKKSSRVCPFQRNDRTMYSQIYASYESVLRSFPVHHFTCFVFHSCISFCRVMEVCSLCDFCSSLYCFPCKLDECHLCLCLAVGY